MLNIIQGQGERIIMSLEFTAKLGPSIRQDVDQGPCSVLRRKVAPNYLALAAV